jgi:hypothetical protein
MKELPFFRHIQGKTLVSLATAFSDKIVYGGDFILRHHRGSNLISVMKMGKVGL